MYTNKETIGVAKFIAPKLESVNDLIEWGIMMMSFRGLCSLVGDIHGKKVEFGFNNISTYDGCMIVPSSVADENFDQSYNLMDDENVRMNDIDNDLTGAKFFNIISGGDCFMVKIRWVDQKLLRGTTFSGKSIMEFSCSQLLSNGSWSNIRANFWHLPSNEGDKLKLIIIPGNIIGKQTFTVGDSIMNSLEFMLRLQFANYYQWFVYIKEYDDLGIRIPISIDSIDPIFKLRDIKADSERKKAVIHWVREHNRRIANTNELNEFTYAKVKQHLRGETKFNWNGLQINIIPSKYDIKRVNSKTKKYHVIK